MKLSIVSLSFHRLGQQRYQKLKSFGYDGTDWSLTETDTPLYQLPLAQALKAAREEKALADSAGITICQIHGPWQWPAKDDTESRRQERMEKMKRSIRIAAEIGCDKWVVHPVMPMGVHDKVQGGSEITKQINLEFMSRLADYAAECGVTVCYENMPFPEFSIGTPAEILEIVKLINKENFRICLDTGHVNFYRKPSPHAPALDVAEEINRVGEYISCLHIHDNFGTGDRHLIPSFGNIKWDTVAAALKKVGYEGYYSLECKLPSLPQELLEDAYRLTANISRHLLG